MFLNFLRQLATAADGVPLFEIFLRMNKMGEYKQQVPILKHVILFTVQIKIFFVKITNISWWARRKCCRIRKGLRVLVQWFWEDVDPRISRGDANFWFNQSWVAFPFTSCLILKSRLQLSYFLCALCRKVFTFYSAATLLGDLLQPSRFDHTYLSTYITQKYWLWILVYP